MLVSNLQPLPARVHILKADPVHFDAVAAGLKTFELRCNRDQMFQTGDVIRLVRHDPAEEAQHLRPRDVVRCEDRRITWILPGGDYGLASGYVALGLGTVEAAGALTAATPPMIEHHPASPPPGETWDGQGKPASLDSADRCWTNRMALVADVGTPAHRERIKRFILARFPDEPGDSERMTALVDYVIANCRNASQFTLRGIALQLAPNDWTAYVTWTRQYLYGLFVNAGLPAFALPRAPGRDPDYDRQAGKLEEASS
jgi:hypothetical protein